MNHEVALHGCSPTPLAAYLKALGVLRLVAEQIDSNVRGYWRDDEFVLLTRLTSPELREFFLESYCPTPLVAPWGARSGFYPGSSESTARKTLERICSSDLERLMPFREIVQRVSALLSELGFQDKVRDEDKLTLLKACRASLPDSLLPWLDACYVLTTDGRKFPPLLGTGGNEGSGSYVSGFAQQVVSCVLNRAHDSALASSLFGGSVPNSGSDQTPGQFSPITAGGPNSCTGFLGGITLNPWDFLFCLEGTLLFAAAATRRLEGGAQSEISLPFTTRAIGSGAGNTAITDEANARAEIWLPLWEAPISVSELSVVLGEGRVRVHRRSARHGLDFARSVATLGVDRGISSFQRYAFLQRFGRNVLAIPLNRVQVRRNPNADLIDQLDHNGWLDRFRRLGRSDHASQRLASLVRRLEDALFDLARDKEAAGTHAQRALTCLGEAQLYLARSPGARENCGPVPFLKENWVATALSGDGSPELRIALALAGLHAQRNSATGGAQYLLPMADHLAPTEQDSRRRWWTDEHNHRVVWGQGSLQGNLLSVLQRRLLEAERLDLQDKPLYHGAPAPLSAVSAWLAESVDTQRIALLLPGLALARVPVYLPGSAPTDWPIPAAFAVLKPFFCTDAQLQRTGLLPEGRLPIPGELVRRLASGQVEPALTLALQRLRIAGLAMGLRHIQPGILDGRHLLAALLVPLGDGDLKKLVYRVLRPTETKTNTTEE